MSTDLLRAAALLLAGVLAACGTVQTAREALPGRTAASPLSGPMAGLTRLPYASMYLRVGGYFHALLLLGHVAADGTQTWYGVDGLALQLRDGQVIHTRGLPVDILDSHAAGPVAAPAIDCGEALAVVAPEPLYYTQLRDRPGHFTELRESIDCRREAIVTPAYTGPALRIDERVALLPGRRVQLRSRWFVEATGQLLRIEYGEHPWYPQIALYLIKPVAPR